MLAPTVKECLIELGRTLKGVRDGHRGEQFCVFAFDCMDEEWAWTPKPVGMTRDEFPMESRDDDAMNWNAAFYDDVAPSHTEKALFDDLGNWVSTYQSTYGDPTSLFIYSLLIPCLRDGKHGNCADNIVAWTEWLMEHYKVRNVHIGWSNEDRDPDIASAIKHMLADLGPDSGQDVNITMQKVSIA